ncbi:hypothetical protein [Granulicella sibirica]|uniref:hypothetical protein n=1 Tax=Granulicella sibirica TaxID=2479048 RepID=UPI001F4F13CD|nr:hypothetical protein [Granulicella sibirica]
MRLWFIEKDEGTGLQITYELSSYSENKLVTGTKGRVKGFTPIRAPLHQTRKSGIPLQLRLFCQYRHATKKSVFQISGLASFQRRKKLDHKLFRTFEAK